MHIIRFDYVRAANIFKSILLISLIATVPQLSRASDLPPPISSCEEILKALVTVSFDTVLEDGERHPALQSLRGIYKQRSNTDQQVVDHRLRENHLRKEMSFQVRNPATGFYDRFVAVPVNGHVAPLMKRDFDRLVRSTGPVLRALRALLQKVYSQKELSVEALGLSHLPASEADLVLKVLRESIYLEEKFIAPQMAEYPFLPVSGFDGAIVDPRKPQNIFFELNLGTPSGLSNNFQLLADLAVSDPEVFAAISPYLPADHTFRLLAETMERNAFSWTKSKGLVVAISPGVYNGAHPDVATIAKMAGIPLVKSSDLYMDQDGNVRLNTGAWERDPVVTGIYDRMEESFFFQSSADNIPLISPKYADQSALMAKTGLTLKPGAIYKWIYNSEGLIVDVQRDSEGRPVLEEVWDTIGADPSRPAAGRGSFASAVLNRKLYVSNLGGRVVDDKRLFRIVSQYLAHSFWSPVASPVKGLSPDDLSALYSDPDSFVVKAPADSGGAGIYFPRILSGPEKEALLAKVKESPLDYEVQYVSSIATLPQAGDHGFDDVAMDLRIFVMMDEAGRVDAGPNSILLRTAPVGGLYSNTSRGGGYGIGVVLNPKPVARPEVPVGANRSVWPVSDVRASEEALAGLKALFVDLETSEITPERTDQWRERAGQLSYEFRGVLHILSGPATRLPSDLRDFAEAPRVDRDAVRRLLHRLEGSFIALRGLQNPMANALSRLVERDFHWWSELIRRQEDPTSESYSPLNRKITYRRLDEPVVSYYWEQGHLRLEKYEMAEITAVDDVVLQKMIEFVKSNGGQVRMMKTRALQGPERRFAGWRYESPYFWVNLDPNSKSFLIPVIGIDLNGDRAVAALAHEIEHFKIWLDAYNERLNQGMTREAAARSAVDHVWLQEMIVYGERRAVEAEMKAERDYPTHPFNQSRGMIRPTEFWQKGYLNRITYPEYQAVRHILNQHISGGRELDRETLRRYLTVMVQTALETRAKALAHLPESEYLLRDYWRFTPMSDLLLKPYGIERLEIEGTLNLFKSSLEEICQEMAQGLGKCG